MSKLLFKHRIIMITVVIMMSSCIGTRAQFSKGTRMPGISIGSAFFNSGNAEYSAPSPTTGYNSNTNSLGFTLQPSMGWFISDHTVIGARINAGYRYQKYIDDINNITFRKKTDKNLTLGLGAFARQYFSVTGKLLPFAQVSVDAGFGNSKTDGFNYTPSYKETFTGKSSGDSFINGGIAAGVTKMLNTAVGLDLYFGYTYTSSKNKFKTSTARDVGLDGTIDENSTSDITTKASNHGLMLGIGFQVFLK